MVSRGGFQSCLKLSLQLRVTFQTTNEISIYHFTLSCGMPQRLRHTKNDVVQRPLTTRSLVGGEVTLDKGQ